MTEESVPLLTAADDDDELGYRRLDPAAFPPFKATPGAAGHDLRAVRDYRVPAGGGRVLVDTGLGLTLPGGTYGRIAERSGLALHHSIAVAGGVVDRDYTGALGVLLVNWGDGEYRVRRGDRIAQLIVERVCRCRAVERASPSATTVRGSRGYGSTGNN